ncbi:hypothetical protein NEOLEDRAFT_986719 [Neolentinus lepideus HHB14362 ss-1]|uniref:Uncharacterized protein n=1 Tax=Neolentinus lepideus HHB14362 ss-1 TaxID=1314782 RepID=A0A165N541_9AGAM|nr:hypothetical protein NEOLEDRAFT_986719 [Neolentinus lepideus HHB14362 ss-1]
MSMSTGSLSLAKDVRTATVSIHMSKSFASTRLFHCPPSFHSLLIRVVIHRIISTMEVSRYLSPHCYRLSLVDLHLNSIYRALFLRVAMISRISSAFDLSSFISPETAPAQMMAWDQPHRNLVKHAGSLRPPQLSPLRAITNKIQSTTTMLSQKPRYAAIEGPA